jgi:hypothetical protein
MVGLAGLPAKLINGSFVFSENSNTNLGASFRSIKAIGNSKQSCPLAEGYWTSFVYSLA